MVFYALAAWCASTEPAPSIMTGVTSAYECGFFIKFSFESCVLAGHSVRFNRFITAFLLLASLRARGLSSTGSGIQDEVAQYAKEDGAAVGHHA